MRIFSFSSVTDGNNFYETTFCQMRKQSKENIGTNTILSKYTPVYTELVLFQSRKSESMAT